MDKLYKVDSKSKIREWSIVVGKDSRGHYYEVSHGVKDGKMQVNRVYIHSGKNMGRSNETDAATQCLLEARALHKKQQDRKGYSNNPNQDSKTKIAPMLAKKFQDEQNNISYPCAVQPKLDGCVDGSTFLTTKNNGRLTIKEIVDNKLDVKVKSYNTKTNKVEYKRVISHFKNKELSKKSQWYEIELESGEKLQVTGCHKIYIPSLKCWRRVDELDGTEEFLLE